ncbi:hypothetical protein F5144DRAFT_380590 [Chaetomium tenue]|uniref:Uncharacterized protein n=1 Tax=Chaetomium tenue TaxID=1854479 RepID=A0ACB7NWE3_9PEZI|nr:hypothetical protein F5144DRAFT_380590 [Chaetomium globosum]
MILQNSAEQARPSWATLPLEISLLILGIIIEERHPGWSSSAAVCKQWQFVIEKENFRHLHLHATCLDDFARIAVRRQHLISYISLNMGGRYDCPRCFGTSWEAEKTQDLSIIREGLWKLFSILSGWTLATQKSLELELRAHSPSSSGRLWFKRNSRQETPPPKLGRLHPLSSIGLRVPTELPRVDVVTRLTLGRQLQRRLQPLQLRNLLDKLGHLEHMVYEPKRGWNRFYAGVLTTTYEATIRNHFPKTLKTLSVFEDPDDRIDPALDYSWWGLRVPFAFHDVDPRIGAAFASLSLSLEQLSAAYMVNAEDFFGACLPTWTWEHLQSLALTSALLHPMGNPDEISALLSSAAATALRMPRLCSLVVWNRREDNACAFVYRHRGLNKGGPSITWRGTWNLEVTPAVEEAWQAVASQKASPLELEIEKEDIEGEVQSHADAISRLALPCFVVVPISADDEEGREAAANIVSTCPLTSD